MNDHDRINHCIESLCELGCEQARKTINTLEAGNTVAQTANLNSHQRQLVLHELKAIMAVYDER